MQGRTPVQKPHSSSLDRAWPRLTGPSGGAIKQGVLFIYFRPGVAPKSRPGHVEPATDIKPQTRQIWARLRGISDRPQLALLRTNKPRHSIEAGTMAQACVETPRLEGALRGVRFTGPSLSWIRACQHVRPRRLPRANRSSQSQKPQVECHLSVRGCAETYDN